jgi:hypothetical protein
MNHWTPSWLARSCAALILGFSSLPAHAQSDRGGLGKGGLQLVLTTSKIKNQPAITKVGGAVAPAKSGLVASVTLNNRSGTEQLLVFPSPEAAARKFTFTLLDSAGKAVALETPIAVQTPGASPTVQRLGKSRRWSRTATLDLSDREGRTLAPGKYTLVAALESDPEVSSSLPIEIGEPLKRIAYETLATARLMRKNDGSTDVQVTAWVATSYPGYSALLKQTGAVPEGVTTVELSVRDDLPPGMLRAAVVTWVQARVTLPWAPGSQFVGLVFGNRTFQLVPEAPWKSGGPAPEDLAPGWPAKFAR